MFKVEGTKITLSRGDTGALTMKANAKRKDTGEPYTFGERDRALFTIKGGNRIVKQISCPIVNNRFPVVFMNADTENFAAGGYNWDVRYVINPYYEDDPPEGEWPDYSELTFPVAAGTLCMHDGTYYMAKENIAQSEDWNRNHWECMDRRIPVDGDQVVTPNTPMDVQLLQVVGDI